MSYCRWSDNCYKCDVYVYESVSGIQISVASNRYVSQEPRPEAPNNMEPAAWIAYWNDVHEWIKRAHVEPIGRYFDGEHIHDLSKYEAVGWLNRLRDIGYTVPEFVIQALQDEMRLE
jgi:hypothetical protein